MPNVIECRGDQLFILVFYVLLNIIFNGCIICLIFINIIGGTWICVTFICPLISSLDEELYEEQELYVMPTIEQRQHVAISPNTLIEVVQIPDINVPPDVNHIIRPPPIIINDTSNDNNNLNRICQHSPNTFSNESFECSICLSDTPKEIIILNCNHSFHEECINEWKKKKSICPLCQKEFT